MNADKAYVALYFDAPLQSWGYQSRFDRRTSLSYPTRSGVMGMLCAAMGIDRGDTGGLKRFRQIGMTTYEFGQEPRMVDYHTVGGGYDRQNAPQNIPAIADSGKPGQTVQSYREYLQNARFGVVLEGTSHFIRQIAAALENPQWGIWLGRKSCIPADIVCQGVYSSLAEAQEKLERLAKETVRRIVREVAEFDEGTDTLNDMPLDFSGERKFAPRRVSVE